MIKITFKNNQDFHSEIEGGFICKFIYATKLFFHKDNKYLLIRLSNESLDFVTYNTRLNNIQSIEHVKPSEL